ncbi:MAG: Dyp-type peroxidase [Xanthomonadales bacterium]|nr:Dyp-type peroxidase [Xanthomonadales bacterium]
MKKTPQAGIFAENTNSYYYLEYQLDFSMPLADIKAALQQALELQTDEVNVVISFGKKAWSFLNPEWQPEDLIDFMALQGVDGFAMPSTQNDVFFWIHSTHHDDNFDAVLNVQFAMEKVAKAQLDLRGFRYHDERDLIGFVDGSANPKGDAKQLAALIPTGEIGEAGSYVLSQKWVHDLAAFNQLSVNEQEQVVGRTKVDSIELEGDAMPYDSHVSRTDLKIDGQAMKIYRRSDPYGTAQEHGLYFLAFACEIRRFSSQLESMLGITDGVHDRLIEFSTAVTGSYWFAPSVEDLHALLS